MKNRNRLTAFAACAALLLSVGVFTSARQPSEFGLGRNIEILVNLLREIDLFYVDEVDPDRLTVDAAAGMVRSLDPYTEYLPEESMSKFEMLTTGKYGGIGSMIRKKGEWVVIAQPYKDSPADRAGLRIGDRILEIDGASARDMSIDEVSARLKGDPGTQVKLRIERLLDGTEKEVTIRRERIVVSGVPYWGMVTDSIGYILHNDFTQDCSDDLRRALGELNADGRLKGLVIDLRSNGGGSLQEAVKIASLFVPKGTEVVSMKGRREQMNAVLRTEIEPLVPDLPIVVLTNSGTASAAEIVAGAMQDLDRAVLMGQRTFGKGLVQSTIPLGYNAYVKLTTAKYYIPSGRCIQAIDYAHRNEDGSVGTIPDSLVHEFRTAGGRKVYDGGGLMPDVKTEPEYSSGFAVLLFAKGYIEDFVDDYMSRRRDERTDPETFVLPDGEWERFVRFMQDKDVEYESQTKRALRMLRESAERERLLDSIVPQVEAIEAGLRTDTQANLMRHRDELTELIENEIILRDHYMQGMIRRNVSRDSLVRQAVELLDTPGEWRRIVTTQDTERK